MKNNITKIISFFNERYFIYLLLCTTILIGCKKEKVDNIEPIGDMISLSIRVSEIKNQFNLLASTQSSLRTNDQQYSNRQQDDQQNIENSNLFYSTSFEQSVYSPAKKKNLTKMAATTVIDESVVYRFIVYEINNGTKYVYRGHKDLKTTDDYSTSSIDIYKDRNYKWIAYSYNNSSPITDILDINADGSTAFITTPIDKDLLYASGDINVPEDNSTAVTEVKVDINFKHRLARLAITLRADDFPAIIENANFSVSLATNNQSYFKSGRLKLISNEISNIQSIALANDLPFSPASNIIGDSTRIAYLYTADFENPLTDLTLKVNYIMLQDIYTYRDGNYPTIENKDIIIKAKSNVIPQPGFSYTPLLNFLNTDGVRKGNLIWARGNLTYNISLSNPYKINKTPNGVSVNAENDYWMYNSLKPWDIDIVSNATHRGVEWTPSLDPCAQVAGGWRLPTTTEYLELGGRLVPQENRKQSSNWNNQVKVTWGVNPLIDVPQNSYTSFKGDDEQWVTFFKTAILTTRYNRSTSTWTLLLNDSALLQVKDGNATASTYTMIQIDGEESYFKTTPRGLNRIIGVRCVKAYTP